MPFWRLYYHLIWATEGRQALLSAELEYQVYDALRTKAVALGGEVFAINGVEDHIHLAVTIPPSISIAKFVGELKGASSFHINHLPEDPHTLDWQRGYGGVSFRKDNLEQVLDYITLQKEHHSSGKLWSSLEDCSEEDAYKPEIVREERAFYDPYA